MSQNPGDWLREFDFIMRPFALHFFRIYTNPSSRFIPRDFGEWTCVDADWINGNPAFKLKNRARTGRRALGFFSYMDVPAVQKAVVVVRYSEGLVEDCGTIR